MDTAPVLLSLGTRVRAERERQGMTLDDLARLADMSKAHLSRIESGDRQPAIATLLTLAQNLGVRVGTLLGEDLARSSIAIGEADGPSYRSNGLDITPVSGFGVAPADLEALRIKVRPDRSPVPFAHHRGEEWLYVLSGALHLEYGPEDFDLGPGMTAHFDSGTPHRLSAPVHGAELLLVTTASPQTFTATHL